MMREHHHSSLPVPFLLLLPTQSLSELKHVEGKEHCRPMQLLALATVLVVAWTQVTQLSRYRTNASSVTKLCKKVGLVTFAVDERVINNFWGV
jgi:hypothetical protein